MRSHSGVLAAAVGVMVVLGMSTVHADHQPVIAVPGHPEVPVVIDGVDASYGVVVGDWGLYAPGRVQPRVIRGPAVLPGPPEYGYFPFTGRPPRYGRHEVEPPPNRRLPPPATSFFRSWSTQSIPPQAAPLPPSDPPPVIMAPPSDR